MAEGASAADGEVRTLWVGDLVRPRASTPIASAVIFHVATTRLGRRAIASRVARASSRAIPRFPAPTAPDLSTPPRAPHLQGYWMNEGYLLACFAHQGAPPPRVRVHHPPLAFSVC